MYTVTYTRRWIPAHGPHQGRVCEQSVWEEYPTKAAADARLHEIMLRGEHVGTGMPFVHGPDSGQTQFLASQQGTTQW